MANFLTEEEKNLIKERCYENWLSNAEALTVLPLLSGKGFLHQMDEEYIKNPACEAYLKNDYLFIKVMLKQTRNKWEELIDILQNDDKHKVFAHAFATILKVPLSIMAGPTRSEGISQQNMEMEVVTPAGITLTGPKNRSVDSYGTKKKSKSGRGKGIVFIIANFTDDLQEYRTDIVCIREFFKEELGYDVFTEIDGISLENVTKDKLLEALQKIQCRVESDGNYDRFYLFVLSHGDENGVLGSDHQSISVEKIVRPFQHDQMKSMKGFPKLFFIQACHGTVYAKAAWEATSKPKAQQLLLTEDDQMICYSVTDSNFSIACDTRGSLFITEMIKAFKKYYKTLEDIREIMREAKDNIAHNCTRRYEANGKQRKYTIQYKF